MGLFGDIQSAYKKSEARVVLENLLEHQAKVGFLDLDPAKLSKKLIDLVWDANPDVFNGKFGQRPHKLTVSASALANGIKHFNQGDRNRYAIVLSLGNILSEVEVNGRLYALNSLDFQLLEAPISIFATIAQESSESPSESRRDEDKRTFHHLPWDRWYRIYKREAGRCNSQLVTDTETGISIIDLMEHEPLKRAHEDGIDPKSLARVFAAQFNINDFVGNLD